MYSVSVNADSAQPSARKHSVGLARESTLLDVIKYNVSGVDTYAPASMLHEEPLEQVLPLLDVLDLSVKYEVFTVTLQLSAR